MISNSPPFQETLPLAGIRLPAAFVDLNAFDRNLDSLLSAAGQKPVRLATKSIRVPELIRRALGHSPRFKGLMCYSAQEAEFLAAQGFDDILVAYPTVQSADLVALRRLHERGNRVALVVDCEEQMSRLSEAMIGSDQPFSCLVEIDASLRVFAGAVHLGVRRSPVRSIQQLKALLMSARQHSGIRVIGAMVYEAQVAGLGDRNPFKRLINPIAALVRQLSIRSVRKLRGRIAEAFRSTGTSLEIFNGGGTGSVNFAASEEALTEVTAGSALLSSHLFDYYSNIRFEPAAFFALQVVRSSDDGYVTCQGGGYIASGEPGWDRIPLPVYPPGLKLVSTEGCGEVQTPLRVPPGIALPLGSVVWFRHSKAGELAERFNEYHLVQDGKIIGSVPTYRGAGQSFG